LALGFVISILPYLLNILLCFLAIPQGEMAPVISGSIYDTGFDFESTSVLFPYLYFNAPVMDALVHSFMVGLFGAGIGGLAYSFSLFFRKNRILLITTPTIIWIVVNMLFAALHLWNLELLELFRSKPVIMGVSVVTVVIWLGALFIVCIIMVLVKINSTVWRDEL